MVEIKVGDSYISRILRRCHVSALRLLHCAGNWLILRKGLALVLRRLFQIHSFEHSVMP